MSRIISSLLRGSLSAVSSARATREINPASFPPPIKAFEGRLFTGTTLHLERRMQGRLCRNDVLSVSGR